MKNISIWANISDWFAEFFDKVKDFLLDNSRNPILWVGIVILGLIIFEFTYKSLHKD